MKKQCRNEVDQLHMFFVDWFTGAAENTDENFARAADVIAPDFVLISPRGDIHDRDEILALIRSAHGSRDAEAFKIWIEDFEARFVDGPFCLATYCEWQEVEGDKTCRKSTVLFRTHGGAPNHVEWVHLHETWLPVS